MMVKDKEEVEEKTKETKEVGLVRLTQDSGVGMQMPDGEVIDVTGTEIGTAQVLAHIVKTLSEVKRNIG